MLEEDAEDKRQKTELHNKLHALCEATALDLEHRSHGGNDDADVNRVCVLLRARVPPPARPASPASDSELSDASHDND